MIHISITTGRKGAENSPSPTLAAQPSQSSAFFQVFQDGRPLSGLIFTTKREARKALRELPQALVAQSYGWYRVELRRNGAVGNILGIRKHFDDGATVDSTFLVRKVSASTSLQYITR